MKTILRCRATDGIGGECTRPMHHRDFHRNAEGTYWLPLAESAPIEWLARRWKMSLWRAFWCWGQA